MKSQSSIYRVQICNLPPKLAFSPSPSDATKGNNDDANNGHQMQLWRNQLREEELWDEAQANTQRLLCDMISLCGQKISDVLIQQFGRRLFEIEEKQQNQFDNIIWLTIDDLENIVNTIQDNRSTDGPDIILHKDMSWQEAIVSPFNDAACAILTLYNPQDLSSNQQTTIRQYLHYRSIRTMEQVKYFTIPFQKRQLLQLKGYHNKQQQLEEHLERSYNDAFEKFDNYCMNVLGVESDTLPLFPDQHGVADSVDECLTMKVIDDYAEQVAGHVRGIMADELEKLSLRFLSFFQDNRKAISGAAEYYQQFSCFLSSDKWKQGHGSANDCKQDEVLIPTLKQFLDSSSNDSLLSEFAQKPPTRNMLIADLQQVQHFLMSRKRELSSRVANGREVAGAIDLAWTQHCITACPSNTDYGLDSITLDDVSQYISAVEIILAQVIGENSHAKRLRLLADTVGTSRKEDSVMFQRICRRASQLTHKMSLYQSQQERTSHTKERCRLDAEKKEEEISLDTCRLDVLIKRNSKLI